jgi:hypothetical protein
MTYRSDLLQFDVRLEVELLGRGNFVLAHSYRYVDTQIKQVLPRSKKTYVKQVRWKYIGSNNGPILRGPSSPIYSR